MTDLLVDGTLDKTMFADKQDALLMERAKIRESLDEARQGSCRAPETVQKTVELAKRPSVLYKIASPEQKRELVKTLPSNLVVSGKNVDVTLAPPFRLIADREKTTDGGPYRGTCRTWEHIITKIHHHLKRIP